MALYAMGDLHLSLDSNKSMEVFGPAWENYTERIRASLARLTAEDALVLAGDTSWGMTLAGGHEADFRFLEQLSLRKIPHQGKPRLLVVHGGQASRSFCAQKGFTTLELLHNSCAFDGRHALCGTRGWFLGGGAKAPQRQGAQPGGAAAGDRPSRRRGIGRFCAFCTIRPYYQGYQCPEILKLLERLSGGAVLLRAPARAG